jgi:cell wall-associated NlpC family hydrolase
MSLKHDHLIGRTYASGKVDCYTLIREFYADNFSITLPNYARPHNWWDHGLNLYMDSFYDHGFRPMNDHPREWRVGDAALMAIRSTIPNHAGVFVEQGKLLHHMMGRLSTVEDYRGLWRNSTIIVLRHKDIPDPTPTPSNIQLEDMLPNAVRQRLAALISR